MATAELDMKDMANRITMTIRIKRVNQWRWRLKLGTWLIRLAALVMWMKPDITIEDA